MILFRADANPHIGSGHIMRTLSIAAAFRERGADCAFVSADDAARGLIAEAGFRHVALGTDWRDMPSELPAMQEVIKGERPELLIVDGYYATADYLASLRRSVRLGYIDDVAAYIYPVDCLINYNVFATDVGYEQRYPSDTMLLLGMDYAPLRAEFRSITPAVRAHTNDILLLTGGADPIGAGGALLSALLAEPSFGNRRLHIVIGTLNGRVEEIQRISEKDGRVVIHSSVTHMAELMHGCDMAVSASGSTLYELCACGVPTVCYTLADNQIPIAEGFHRRGIMQYAGDFRDGPQDVAHRIATRVLSLMDCEAERRALSQKMTAIVDGNGARRIADALL